MMPTTTRWMGTPYANLLVLLSVLSVGCVAHASGRIDDIVASRGRANALLQQGRVDEARAVLEKTLATEPEDPATHHLLCRVYYAQDLFDDAVRECEQAADRAPGDSIYRMWLGRAYGQKAAHANPFHAYGLARKTRTSMERAVALDSENFRALNDLGDFYTGAPGLVGGGLDKAQTLAARVASRFPSQSHRLLGLIAEKQGDLGKAEVEFKAAVAAGKTPAAYVDLGHYYQRHQQPEKMLRALEGAIERDAAKDAALVDVASILTASQVSRELAENALRSYLASPAKSDDAPAFKVHIQLGDLLRQRGDTAGAHREYAAAAGLASHFEPAHKALQAN